MRNQFFSTSAYNSAHRDRITCALKYTIHNFAERLSGNVPQSIVAICAVGWNSFECWFNVRAL